MRWIVVAVMLLAGCADSVGLEEDIQGVSDETGAIKGVVVDQAIVPVADAEVRIAGQPPVLTGRDGAFRFDDLDPGAYFLNVTQPFFSAVQVQVFVDAGQVSTTRILLERIIFGEPYLSQWHLVGFLTCSSNTGGLIAEECGEGVGVPCSVPVIGCQRIGGNPENVPEVTFFADSKDAATVQAEIVWDPTFTVGNGIQEGGFTTILATHFVCDPVCRYEHALDDKVGHSPIIMRTDDGDQGGKYFTDPDVSLADANITGDTPISVFVWTSDEDLAAVTFDQRFEVLATISYFLPLPEGFSVVASDEPPF